MQQDFGSHTLARAAEIARRAQARVVMPELDGGGDERLEAAAKRLEAEGLARIVPLAAPSVGLIEAVMATRPMRAPLLERLIARPLPRAGAMLAAGEADVMIAGVSTPTRRVIEAASMTVGFAEGITTPSSFFVMSFPDGREMLWGDCALNVAPDAERLAAIARATARSAEALLGEARVALLSYSTGSSGAGESVETVRAAALASGFEGPVQADAALDAEVARRKGAEGGDANALIFPSLDAGNIAYKLARALSGARAFGPVLQGFRKPVCDLSRGASVDEIVATTVLAIALAEA